MVQVTVFFFGICTHIKADAFQPRPAEWQRRTVLPRADEKIIEHHPRLGGIAPHVASLQLQVPFLAPGQLLPSTAWCRLTGNDPDRAIWSLDGALLRILDALDSDPREERCIPHLRHRCHGGLPALGRAAEAGDRDLTWAAFDFPAVSPAGNVFGEGAAVGVVPVSVDAAVATLEIRPIDAALGEPIFLALRDGAQITVANIPVESGTDSPEDFRLHFLVTDTIPEGITPPPKEPADCGLVQTDNIPVNISILTGPGCSNSTWP